MITRPFVLVGMDRIDAKASVIGDAWVWQMIQKHSSTSIAPDGWGHSSDGIFHLARNPNIGPLARL